MSFEGTRLPDGWNPNTEPPPPQLKPEVGQAWFSFVLRGRGFTLRGRGFTLRPQRAEFTSLPAVFLLFILFIFVWPSSESSHLKLPSLKFLWLLEQVFPLCQQWHLEMQSSDHFKFAFRCTAVTRALVSHYLTSLTFKNVISISTKNICCGQKIPDLQTFCGAPKLFQPSDTGWDKRSTWST